MENILESFFEGSCYNAYKYFGAHPLDNGYVFRVYAPNAKEIELVGDFNNWNGSNHKMNKIDNRGIYELFVKEIKGDYQVYKYNIRTRKDKWITKADPYAFFSELRPNSASKTFNIDGYKINDESWMNNRTKCNNSPMNIYEVHLGSFKQKEDGSWYSYEEIAEELIKYVKENNFTHVEFMPVMEHPFDGSWGYQVTQYYSITSRYGNPTQLKILVEKLHNANIGIIADFVPVHFAKDNFSLTKFDGTCVYESYSLDRRCSQWGTYLFDYTKPEVMSYLLSCAYYYLNEFHFDGLRFDAISNMIYKDGNRDNGEQAPNINWMKKTNDMLARLIPTAMLIAEDSSDYYGVTKPVFEGGLGFDYKWDLGWMNDTLKYLKEDPYFRGDHLNYLNFSMYYFYNERFLLPFSHDEVVHMKGSIINKMFGSYEQKFQQVRALYTYMFTHPGKKLNFMGNELALFDEWSEKKPLYTDILKYPVHDAFNKFFKDLGKLYISEPALYSDEYNNNLFRWIDCSNKNNVFIYERFYKDDEILVVLNFSGTQFDYYKFKTSKQKGYFYEVINSDNPIYNGYGCLNTSDNKIDKDGCICIKIPAFSGMVFKYKSKK